jgi:hypothetical protein
MLRRSSKSGCRIVSVRLLKTKFHTPFRQVRPGMDTAINLTNALPTAFVVSVHGRPIPLQ